MSIGFDALGHWALGHPRDGNTPVTLVASPGAFTLTGVAATFAGGEPAAAGAYVLTGQSEGFAVTLTSVVGGYVLTGNGAVFAPLEGAGAGAYALAGKAAAFAGSEPASPAAFMLSGVAISDTVALPAVSGAFVLTGYGIVEPIVMPAGAASYALTPGNTTLSRTGADFDLVYGGVGHFLEELERQRQLARITRKTPAPIDRRVPPSFRPLGSSVPSVAARPPTPDLAALRAAMERHADECAMRTRQQRQRAALLLLAS